MPLKQIRINGHTVEELRTKGKDFGSPTDDVIIRLTLAENEKLTIENNYLKSVKSENECLKTRIKELEGKLAECKKKDVE